MTVAQAATIHSAEHQFDMPVLVCYICLKSYLCKIMDIVSINTGV